MQIVYAQEALPSKITKTVFLAGPTPRHQKTRSWRPDALKLLEEAGFDGHVFVPEGRDGKFGDYTKQIEWEQRALNASDVILFWIPRKVRVMPGFTTNNEFGIWSTLDPARVFLGAPKGAPHTNYQFKVAEQNDIPSFRKLDELCQAVVKHLGAGAEREAGACKVPLHVWKAASFQAWYQAQTKAGIQLHDATVKFIFRPVPKFVLFWALKVDMYIPSENRHKTNEVVISRPDVCLTVAWHRPKDAEPQDTLFALIREYRTPAVSEDAFAWENPGGSSFKPGKDPKQTAADELKEELGLEFDAARVKVHCARQVASTLSAHRSHVYSVELTAEEIASLQKQEADGATFGNADETEKTYPRVRSLKQIRDGRFADWSTIGIVTTVLFDCGVLK
ncbi:MAG TPA: nucleoside 2-deoxyribosyltransferase domain-containing protein [Planktothrix sp.]